MIDFSFQVFNDLLGFVALSLPYLNETPGFHNCLLKDSNCGNSALSILLLTLNEIIYLGLLLAIYLLHRKCLLNDWFLARYGVSSPTVWIFLRRQDW